MLRDIIFDGLGESRPRLDACRLAPDILFARSTMCGCLVNKQTNKQREPRAESRCLP
jgi:hypothetical protein